jgi:hypothetical protein
MPHSRLLPTTFAAFVALAASLSIPSPAWGQKIVVSGIVTDSASGQPIKGATVYIANGGKTTTDAQGVFHLKNVDPLKDIMQVRSVGYVPSASRFARRPPGSEVDVGTIPLQPLAVMLDSLTVEAQLTAQDHRLADFYRRRANSAGKFFTKTEIVQRNPMFTSDLLRSVTGLVMICDRGPCTPSTARRYGIKPSQAYCPMQVMVDGAPVAISVDEIPPAWIVGIEVYQGSAQGPAEYGGTLASPSRGSGSGAMTPSAVLSAPMGVSSNDLATPFCGTVAIWTGGGQGEAAKKD